MPYSYAQYPGNGATVNFSVPFPYLLRSHVRLYLGYNLQTGGYDQLLADGTGYTWNTGGTQITLSAPHGPGQLLTIKRETPTNSRLVDWADGSRVVADNLDTADLQVFYAVQEQLDFLQAYIVDPSYSLPNNSIVAAMLSADSVVANKIANKAVTEDKLADSIDSGKFRFTQAGVGSVARTVASKLRDVVSIKDFGAAGDGVTDDSTAIQAAIDSVPYGQRIELHFPNGNYRINGAVTFNGRFISFALGYLASFSGAGTINGSLAASTNWQFARRIVNRLYVGSALNQNDGALWSNGPASFSQDWVEQEVASTSAIAQFVSVSDTGYQGILGASRTSDSPLPSSEGTMGLAGIVVADKIPQAGPASAYGVYAEARRKGGAGFAHGIEINVISRIGAIAGSAAITTPLLQPQSSFGANPALIGGWFSNSRPDIADGGDASVGIGLINNAGSRTGTQGRYKVGILFDQKSILGADGSNYASSANVGQAIALGVGHAIGWWNANATTAPLSSITSTDNSNSGIQLDFAALGLAIQQSGGEVIALFRKTSSADGCWQFSASTLSTAGIIELTSSGDRAIAIRSANNSAVFLQNGNGTALSVYAPANAANYMAVNAAPAGQVPYISCNGLNPDIDLGITPKGAGLVRFGTHSPLGGQTVTGYITIKDANGVARKLAVVS